MEDGATSQLGVLGVALVDVFVSLFLRRGTIEN
jgi:hypothetical protein